MAGFLTLVTIILFLVGDPRPESRQEAAQQPAARSVTVVGEGEVRVRPDLVRITFGVLTYGASASEAEALNLASAEGVREALVRAGLPEASLTVSGPLLSVSTVQDGTGAARIGGFRAHSRIHGSVTDLRRVQAAIDAALTAGATSVDEVVYTLRDPEAARQAAMRNALANARERATALVRATGRRLGELLAIEVLDGDEEVRTTTAGSLILRSRVRATYGY